MSEWVRERLTYRDALFENMYKLNYTLYVSLRAHLKTTITAWSVTVPTLVPTTSINTCSVSHTCSMDMHRQDMDHLFLKNIYLINVKLIVYKITRSNSIRYIRSETIHYLHTYLFRVLNMHLSFTLAGTSLSAEF